MKKNEFIYPANFIKIKTKKLPKSGKSLVKYVTNYKTGTEKIIGTTCFHHISRLIL